MDNIIVKHLGSSLPLKDVVTISLKESDSFYLSIMEHSTKDSIIKALESSEYNLIVSEEESKLVAKVGKVGKEGKKLLIRQLKQIVENFKKVQRDIRQENIQKIKRLSKIISADIARNMVNQIEEITKKTINEIVKIADKREEMIENY